MKMIPLRERKSFVYPSLLVSSNRCLKSVVVSSIAFETAFGYCVGCKTGGYQNLTEMFTHHPCILL